MSRPAACVASVATKSRTTSAPAPFVASRTSATSPSTSCAPSSRASARRRSSVSIPITVPPPRILTSWSAIWPTPPTPMIAVVVPGTSRGRSFFTAWYAVIPASECGATAWGVDPDPGPPAEVFDEGERDRAAPADADDRRGRAGHEPWQELLHGVVRGDPRVGVRGDRGRLDAVGKLHQRALVDEHVL